MAVLPAAQLEPALYGLVNPKTLIPEAQRWEGGFEQESLACIAEVRNLDICNTASTSTVKEREGSYDLGSYKPFAVQTELECSTMGGYNRDWERLALDALEACTSKGVEHEFWTGALAQEAIDNGDTEYPNRYLNNGDAVDLTPTPGTAIKPRFALALLEGALARAGCGTRGYIHAPVSVASVLPVKDDGGILRTTMGNYVIAGTGYPGTGTGVDDPVIGSEMWIYATGPVMVRLGESQVAGNDPREFVNRATNTITLTAERPASVIWDGCAHFGVLVDLSLDYA